MEYQATYILPLSLGFACVKSVRDCILVPARRTRSCCAAMHAASSFPSNRRRHAALAGACLRPTTWARQHRASITSVCGHCLFGPWLNLSSAAAWELRIHLICERAPRLLSSGWHLELHVDLAKTCFYGRDSRTVHVLVDPKVARYRSAASMSSTDNVISLSGRPNIKFQEWPVINFDGFLSISSLGLYL